MKREHEIVAYIFSELGAVSNIKILAGQHQDRLCISFYVDDLHFNLGVKLLNDKFEYKLAEGAVVLVPMDTFVTRRPRNVP
jgi:hypothetical protein